MVNFTRTNKIVILIIAIVITTGIGVKMLIKDNSKSIEIEENGLFLDNDIKDEVSDDKVEAEDTEKLPEEVVVHITGEVARPGIVTLKNGSRVVDAIKMAGGLKSSADETNINLAQKLFDEDKIVIPKIGEDLSVQGFALQGTESVQIDSPDIVMSKNSTTSSGNSNSNGQININTASKEELKTLSGIGEVTAQKIIDYRESTKFSSIEDIKNVSGIGDKKFEAIKSMIKIR